MGLIRLILAPRAFVCGIFISGLLFGAVQAKAAGEFPYDQELMLDAVPMRPGRRIPILAVAPDGKATIDLWCKSVTAQVELSDASVKIEPGPLPEALPEMIGTGQCTPERMQADQDLLAAFTQVTSWRSQGSALVLEGPKTLEFRPATN
jgi:heat shock protein HslJ